MDSTLSGKVILVVDDSPDIQVLVSQLLKKGGYSVRSAYNGQEALNFLRATSELPHAILLDLMMPVMDGFQFRDEQVKDPLLAQIPVVVMTAGGDIEAKAAKIKAASFLKKPFTSVEAILNVLQKCFSIPEATDGVEGRRRGIIGSD